MGSRWVNTAGTTFRNADGSSRQKILSEMVGTNRRVYLLDASSGEYPEAIAVYNDEWQQMGFVPKEMARSIRNKGIDVDEISISRCRCYKWFPKKRKSYGDDFEHQGQELYGCKFVIEHDLIDGDADDYEDRPVRSLNLTWDGIDLYRTDEPDDNWNEENLDEEDDNWLISNKKTAQRIMTPEEEERKRQQEIERELAEIEKDRQYRRQGWHEFITVIMIVFFTIAVASVLLYSLVR